MISVNRYLQNVYGRKLYKISIDAGFTCPVRDGKLDTRGCIFCSARGSGDFTNRSLDITEQIEKGKEVLASKFRSKTEDDLSYIAYFQAFTNTYAPVEELERKYMEAVRHPNVAVISIATRPDCLQGEVLALLERINMIKPVWVELGLQTIHKKSAEYIRRGYELEIYDEAVRNLNSISISQIITHVIFGLPGENRADMLETVRYVASSGATGIKLQLLHVLKGTDLEKDYNAGLFETLTMEEYISLVAEAVKLLPENMVVHRMTGDGDRKLLVAPLWSTDKKTVLNRINKEIGLSVGN